MIRLWLSFDRPAPHWLYLLLILCCVHSLSPTELWAEDPPNKVGTGRDSSGDKSLEDILFEGQEPKSAPMKSAQLSSDQLLWELDTPSEPNPFTANLRWTLDLSSRGIVETGARKWRGVHAIGLDVHKVFSSASKDWGTLVAQLYLTRIDRVEQKPYFFDDNHDWELVVRIFNFNLTGLFDGRLNLRAGHFDIPFGLEYTINTNGTLKQFLTVANLGLKNDFGFTVNGVLKDLEYEVAISRGTWNELYSRNDPFIFSGRMGSTRENNFIVGVSGFYGDVATPSTNGPRVLDLIGQQRARRETIRRWRVGIDLQYYWYKLGFIGESSVGVDARRFQQSSRGQRKWNSLLEINWQFDSTVQLYSQYRAFLTQLPRSSHFDETSLTSGLRWTPALYQLRAETRWALSAQLSQQLSNADHSPRDLSLSLQFRVRL